MDVRCEKCQTEYELDESRLKPGGVTVKCTTCGHMFKIRKRSPTQSGIPVPAASRTTPRPGAPSRPPEQPARATEPPRAVEPPRGRDPQARAEARTVPERRPASTDPRADLRAPVAAADARGSGGTSMPPASAEGDRAWIIRLENGEQRTCRELGTLQQWIIMGAVTRESMISRSGKTWKRLGDIAELTTFFTVADEAQHARAARGDRRDFDPEEDTRPTGPTAAERRTAIGPAAAPLPAAPMPRPPAPAPAPVAAAPLPAPSMPRPPAAAPLPAPLPAPPAPPPSAPSLLAVPPAAASLPTAPPVRLAATPPPQDAAPVAPMAERKTGGWAVDGVAPAVAAGDSGAEGPKRGVVKASDSQSFGGIVRPVGTDDVGFGGGPLRGGPLRGGPLAASDDATIDFDDDAMPRRRGAGLWIALGSLAVIGGAAAAVYFLVLGPKKDGDRQPAAVLDAAVPQVATADAGGLAPDPVTADAGAAAASALVDEARAQLGRDTAAGLIASGKALADATDTSAPALALRARLLTAQAQIIEDEAALAADAATAARIRRDGKQLVLDALTLAQKALKQAPADPDANLAMADVLRLQGRPAAEVRKYLSAVKGDAAAQREAALVGALLDVRDKQAVKAQQALARLDGGDGALERTGDVRVRWRLAALAAASKQPDAARAAAEAVLAAQPDHAGARALLAKVAAVAQDDPMPPEDGPAPGPGTGATPGTGTGTAATPGPGPGPGPRDPGPSAGEGYDRLLARAHKLAEVSCTQAIPYYQKALEAKPNSVEALTGMGYCHLDAKQFSSAHSKFRAALGISPKYERALWGMAELYQQQGRAELAIEAYKAYLEVYPRSAAAQRQLDRLQGKAPGTPTPPETGGGGGGDDGPATSPGPVTSPGPATSPTPAPDPNADPTPPPPRPDLPPSE